MTDQQPLRDHIEQDMEPLLARIDERYWEKTRAVTIGGAGLSTALVLLLTQVGLDSCALSISFFCAAIGIPAWIATWQVGDAYDFHGLAAHVHLTKLHGFGIGVLLFLTSCSLLFISLFGLIWHFSAFTALAFLIATVGMVVFVYRHHQAVRASASRDGSDGV